MGHDDDCARVRFSKNRQKSWPVETSAGLLLLGIEMNPNMIVQESPDPRTRAALSDMMLAYNESKTGPSGFAHVAVILQDDAGELIGGLWGRSVYDWLFVEFLIVPEHLRGHGLGKAMMSKAEEIALSRGCIGVCLDTFDFNAPGFYRKLGYDVVAALESPRRGFKRHIFRKFIGR